MAIEMRDRAPSFDLSQREKSIIQALIAAQEKARNDVFTYSIVIGIAVLTAGFAVVGPIYSWADHLAWWQFDLVLIVIALLAWVVFVSVPALATYLAYRKVEHLHSEWAECIKSDYDH
jgi:hypothetical protein